MSYDPYEEYIKEFKSAVKHFFIVVKRMCKYDIGDNIKLVISIEKIINKANKLSDVYIDKIANGNNIDVYSSYELFNKVILEIFSSLSTEYKLNDKMEDLIFVNGIVKDLMNDIIILV